MSINSENHPPKLDPYLPTAHERKGQTSDILLLRNPASESFDVGVDLGSVVSRDYAERRPFKFDGEISKVSVELK